MVTILGAVGIAAVLALIIFPGFRKKLKVLVGGFLNIFLEDVAKTPEGARAVYDQAIEEAQKQYNEADTIFRRQSGELDQLRTRIATLKNNLKITEDHCQALVKAGNIENAKTYAEQRSEILTELNQKVAYEHDLALAVEQVKNIHTLTGNKLRKLQTEKKQVIDGMKLDASMKSVLDDLDDLKRSTETEKMIGTVRDHAADLRKEVQGGMVVHANRTSTKIAAAEKAAADVSSDDYITSLMNKYGKSSPQTGAVARG